MKKEVILKKLESLGHCIHRIEEKRPPVLETLTTDFDIQDIISINLERSIQISVDICSHILANLDGKLPATMGEGFIALAGSGILSPDLAERLRKAVGFRNISVHEYTKIDWKIVFSIITDNLDDFRDFAQSILTYIES